MCRCSDILNLSLPLFPGPLMVPFSLRKFAKWPPASPSLSHWAVGRIDSGNSVKRTWGEGWGDRMEILHHCTWLQDSPWVGVGVRWGLRRRERKAEASSGKWGKNRGDKIS